MALAAARGAARRGALACAAQRAAPPRRGRPAEPRGTPPLAAPRPGLCAAARRAPGPRPRSFGTFEELAPAAGPGERRPGGAAESAQPSAPAGGLGAWDPEQLAELVIEALEHQVEGLPGESPVLQYDDGSVRRRLKAFLGRAGEQGLRNVRKLFDVKPHVHLDGRGFDELDVLVVARLARFRAVSELRMLQLNGNCAGSVGAGFLGKHVVRHCQLRSLFLSGNGIGDAGAASLAEALRANRSLMLLELRRNGITDDGAGQLAEALRSRAVTTQLDRLYLNDNAIGDAGALALAEARPEGTRLWLEGNPISGATRARIEARAGKHVKFDKLGL